VRESYRTFIAIELPHEIRAHVVAHINQLRQSAQAVTASWNREDNLHLTLKFLGDVPAERIEALSHATAATVSQTEPFLITIGGSGTFPPRSKPNVLWIGIEDPSGTLARLHRNLEDECAKVGFAREARAFHPHLTIARLRKPQHGREIADLHRSIEFPEMRFTVSEVVGFKSELLAQGARHSALFRHELAQR
jgi:RNA 2',3'-cyclic 3'-phosphodiesterase